MQIIINGQTKEFPNENDLYSLINGLCQTMDHIIAELNGVIIKKDQWKTTILTDGDSIELISFVGGG